MNWQEGWPIVELGEEKQGLAVLGPRIVKAERNGSNFSMQFALKGVGRWEYSVSADGKVESKSPVVHPIGATASQLPSDLPGKR